MQSETDFRTPALFSIDVFGKDVMGFEAIKVQLIPFAPKVGDVFLIEGDPQEPFAHMAVLDVAYNLSKKQYNVSLDASGSDWRDCEPDELADIDFLLSRQGWVIRYHNLLY